MADHEAGADETPTRVELLEILEGLVQFGIDNSPEDVAEVFQSDYEKLRAAIDRVTEGDLEWGVEYGTYDAMRAVNRFADRESCERFISHPPLWADPVHLRDQVIVTRRAASPWQPALTSEEGATP